MLLALLSFSILLPWRPYRPNPLFVATVQFSKLWTYYHLIILLLIEIWIVTNFSISHTMLKLKKQKTLCMCLWTPEQINILPGIFLTAGFLGSKRKHIWKFLSIVDIAKYIAHQKITSIYTLNDRALSPHPWQYLVFTFKSAPTWWAGWHLVILFSASLI